jgi:hypothetical protein
MAQVVQTLDARYIDGAALLSLLKQLFGRGNFAIDVRPPKTPLCFLLTLNKAY